LPPQYGIRCRVERAKTLLASPLPIADVACQVGCAHQT
jgi:AraC family transcriptional regulator